MVSYNHDSDLTFWPLAVTLTLGGTDLCVVRDTMPSHDTHIYQISSNNV